MGGNRDGLRVHFGSHDPETYGSASFAYSLLAIFPHFYRLSNSHFLCRYLSSEALRREIHQGLNVIENPNGATAFIFYGHEGDFQTNRLDEQESGPLTPSASNMPDLY
jgi:TnpA family transposase